MALLRYSSAFFFIYAAFTTRFISDADLAELHAAVDRFGHVVDGEGGNGHGRQRFHLDAGLAAYFDRRFNLHRRVCFVWGTDDINLVEQQGMAERNQFTRSFGGHDSRHLGQGQHIPLLQIAGDDQPQGVWFHGDFATGNGNPLRDRFIAHVDHLRLARFIEMCQFIAHRHGIIVTKPATSQRRPSTDKVMQPVSAEDLVAPFYDTILLSPHLDDAALSCGGQIFLQTTAGRPVLIVTIMAGDPLLEIISPYAQSLHDRWEYQSGAAARRREEDLAACRILNADCLHWGIPDCIYRHDPVTGASYYNSDENIFGPLHANEQPLLDTLAGKLAQLPAHKRLLAPLSAGNHVDHQLTRLAAERCFGTELIYYEEYPYAAEAGVVDRLTTAKDESWHAQTIPLSPTAVKKKIEAIAAYTSQLSTFFLDRADLEQQVTSYSQLVGGERLWRREGRLPH